MRYRPILAVAAAAALVATLPAHAGGIKTLDGKKVKSLTFSDVVSAPQDNDKDFASTSSSDRTVCTPPRCSKFTFLFKPAKGVKYGAFSAKITWTYPVEDYDLYIVQDNAGDVGHCGAGAGTSEVVVISDPMPGHKYTVVIDHYRAVPDTVTATVTFPAASKVATAVPDSVDSKSIEPIDCGIS
jgi:hypothetical protein